MYKLCVFVEGFSFKVPEPIYTVYHMHVAYVYESHFLQVVLVFHFEQVSFTCFVC